MHKSNVVFLVLTVILLISCGKKVVVVEQYDSGNPKVTREFRNRDTLNYIESYFYEGGNLKMQGKVVHKEREGYWKSWYEDGTLWSEGQFKAGRNNGIHNVYYENGQTRYSGQYKDGTRCGTWQFYDTLGNLLDKKIY